jgi:RNA polymerase sigma-70 factor (ECF subfamily)
MLAEDVQAISDGGGEFHTARRVVRGRDKVARFFIGLNRRTGAGVQSLIVNVLPAVLVHLTPASTGWSPRALLQGGLDAEGRIRTVYTVLATRKVAPLTRV